MIYLCSAPLGSATPCRGPKGEPALGPAARPVPRPGAGSAGAVGGSREAVSARCALPRDAGFPEQRAGLAAELRCGANKAEQSPQRRRAAASARGSTGPALLGGTAGSRASPPREREQVIAPLPRPPAEPGARGLRARTHRDERGGTRAPRPLCWPSDSARARGRCRPAGGAPGVGATWDTCSFTEGRRRARRGPWEVHQALLGPGPAPLLAFFKHRVGLGGK